MNEQTTWGKPLGLPETRSEATIKSGDKCGGRGKGSGVFFDGGLSCNAGRRKVEKDSRPRFEPIHQHPLFCGRAVNYFRSRNERTFRKSLQRKELRRCENSPSGKKFTTVTPLAVIGEIVVKAIAARVYSK